MTAPSAVDRPVGARDERVRAGDELVGVSDERVRAGDELVGAQRP